MESDHSSLVERFVGLAGERGGAAASPSQRALALLDASPELRSDPWVALSLGDASGIRAATEPGGPLARPPLFYVARSRVAADTVTAARDLLARGADPNGPGGEEWTNLSIACARGDAPLARLLLEAGARPNDNDSLYHSVEPSDDACLRLLLEHGATVPGTSALHHALDYERLEPVRLLLEHGGDPNESDDWPALHHAVFRGRSPAFVELLIAHGADPSGRDGNGRTAYQHAVRRGSAEVAETLRELGSPTDLTAADRALNAIATGGPVDGGALDEDAADILIELAMTDAGTLARVVDAVGPMFSAQWGGGPRGTLLHQAAWFGRVELVELLLRRGADPNAVVETEYATPLGWAAVGSRYSPDHPSSSFSAPDADHVGVARLLVGAGAAIEAKDVEMATAPLSAWLAAAREQEPLPLHVTNGESAAGTLRLTGLGGGVLSWQDALHEGPVPALPRPELLRTRAAFLAACGWGTEQALLASLERRDAQFLEALRAGRPVVLWFEHDLYDQLQLLDALALAHGEEAAPDLIVADSFLGELTAGELEQLWPSRRPAEPAALEAAAAAWAAFQAPDPSAVAEWANRETTALPHLAPALRRLLEELPSTADGLSRTERQALAAIGAGARTPADAFVASQRLEEARFLGDTWFFRTLAELGQGEARLVETEEGAPLPQPPPLGDGGLFARLRLRLTETGARTLRGEADRVELLGIDRFVGGTHVTPNSAWRWDAVERKLSR